MHNANILKPINNGERQLERYKLVIEQEKASEIVRLARDKCALNQQDFAFLLGKTQSILSRYETGSVSPPAEIVIRCMHILKGGESVDEIEAIVVKVRALNEPQFAAFRKSINLLLDAIVQV